MTNKRMVMLLTLALGTLVVGVAVLRETAVAQPALDPQAYLPLVISGDPVIGPVHQGIATYYNATGAGNCGFPVTPNDLMVAALNNDEYDNAKWCGAYVRVDGKKGSVVVRIVDRCPECSAGHLDLSREAFAIIDDIPLGRVPISWQVISPNLPGPIAYYFDPTSSQWWAGVQVRNHRNPIVKFEYRNSSGVFVSVPRQMWNRFDAGGMGLGPFTFRVTDVLGSVIQDSGIPLTPGGVVQGHAQFPPP
ncbi:MAG: expansin EXLX1 family cellulose-binding protein [Chloroflexota bacterium]